MIRRWILVLLACLATACASPSKTTDTRSKTLPDDASRRQFLNPYFPLPSEVKDLTFHVTYRDNSGGMVPGPSDYDIRVLAEVKPESVKAWQGQLQPDNQNEDLSWIADLKQLDTSKTELYGNSKNLLVVFPESNLVARRVTTY